MRLREVETLLLRERGEVEPLEDVAAVTGLYTKRSPITEFETSENVVCSGSPGEHSLITKVTPKTKLLKRRAFSEEEFFITCRQSHLVQHRTGKKR